MKWIDNFITSINLLDIFLQYIDIRENITFLDKNNTNSKTVAYSETTQEKSGEREIFL